MNAANVKPKTLVHEAETAPVSSEVQPGFARPYLSEFRPWRALITGATPFFESACSAQNFMRNNKQALAEVEAVAVHQREVLVHLQRFAAVVERTALDKARIRAGIKT